MAVSALLQSSFWKEVLANLGRPVVQGPGVISVVIYIRTLIWSGRSVLRWNENFHTVCANNSWKDMCIRASVDGQKHGWWKLYKQWILKITNHSSLHHLKCWFWGINKQQSYWTSETIICEELLQSVLNCADVTLRTERPAHLSANTHFKGSA